jgi:DNA invertase Pin-like site-specific DNA recombinase
MAQANVDVVFHEEASGANTARTVLADTLASLHAGDTLVVWRLDRLGRGADRREALLHRRVAEANRATSARTRSP